jgi:hypothetical protein
MIFRTAPLFKTRFRPFEVALLVVLVEEAMECELEQGPPSWPMPGKIPIPISSAI